MSGIVAQNLGKYSGLIKAPEGGGAWNFIKKLSASSSGTLSFVDGSSDVVLDTTYKEYLFYFVNMHPSADGANFQFNGSSDTGSNYNVTKTTTWWKSTHNEADNSYALSYDTGMDLAQSTAFQNLNENTGADADQGFSGFLHLFDPASTTFVKHFSIVGCTIQNSDYMQHSFVSGYFNTTSVVDAIQFKFASGDIDSGSIFLHGIST